jgi:hypothetical protein
MKQFVLILSFLSAFISYGQVTVTQSSYYYVSKWTLEELQDLPVGSKILFQQNCTTKLPANVPTGVVFFENVFHQKERFSMAVEFKDTVIVSVTYYLSAKQKNLLKHIGYSEIKANGSAVKGQWTYTLDESKRRTTIVGDRKRIIVIQSL